MGWLLASVLLVVALTWLGRRFLPETRSGAAQSPVDPPPELVEAAPLGDELDLHGVPPTDVGAWVDAFVDEALEQHHRRVRIIHGKGIGALRQTVRRHLERHPGVAAFRDAPPPSGWGATVVELRVPDGDVAPDASSS